MTYVSSMFKTLLLHAIYEQCIEVAFEGIRKSFSSAPTQFTVGQKFMVMEVAYNGSREIAQLLWHCHIDNITDQVIQISHSDYDDYQRRITYVANVNIYDITIPHESSAIIYGKFEDYLEERYDK